jgi:hypothetical protein
VCVQTAHNITCNDIFCSASVATWRTIVVHVTLLVSFGSVRVSV